MNRKILFYLRNMKLNMISQGEKVNILRGHGMLDILIHICPIPRYSFYKVH